MKFINMLLSYNIKPILVFDGQKLPAKMETEKKRKEYVYTCQLLFLMPFLVLIVLNYNITICINILDCANKTEKKLLN